jgi:hypothetical protein
MLNHPSRSAKTTGVRGFVLARPLAVDDGTASRSSRCGPRGRCGLKFNDVVIIIKLFGRSEHCLEAFATESQRCGGGQPVRPLQDYVSPRFARRRLRLGLGLQGSSRSSAAKHRGQITRKAQLSRCRTCAANRPPLLPDQRELACVSVFGLHRRRGQGRFERGRESELLWCRRSSCLARCRSSARLPVTACEPEHTCQAWARWLGHIAAPS